MLFELLANELDHASYRQEEAVAAGYLSTATLRRSIEDHARLVDHKADPSHSATAMLRFEIDAEGAEALGLTDRFADGRTLVIPSETLAVNPDFDDLSLIFATESDLVYDPRINDLRLHPSEEVEPGALSALLAGDVALSVADRWLVFLSDDPDGPDRPGHVVRVVSVEKGTDQTRIFWDPRRPAPARYTPAATKVKGNVPPESPCREEK